MAENSYGYNSGSGPGIAAYQATNCYGVSSGSGIGVSATLTATSCYGQSISGYGIDSKVATSCYGSSTSSTGLHSEIATNSYGKSSSGVGLDARSLAVGCYAENNTSSLTSLYTYNAALCVGSNAAGPSATGILTTTANGCLSNGNIITATNKYNTP
jgi:hypothetical protein